VTEVNRGLAADPESARLMAMRAFARERMKDAKNALLDANRAIKLDPEGKMNHPYHTRGNVYLWIEKNPKKAIPEYTESIKRYARASGSFYCRGCAYYQLKEYEKAADDFTEAIRINPEYAEAYWQRALIAYKDKDATTAMRDLNLAIEKSPK